MTKQRKIGADPLSQELGLPPDSQPYSGGTEQAARAERDAKPWAGTPLLKVQRGELEELRISIDEFKGFPFINLRIWAKGDDGWVPTKKGATIRRRELQEVITALSRAEATLNGEGG
ncbi:MAG: transcriptional coactivator p15/PC4 family protein [Pseudomonadota bacterium]